MEWFKDGPVFKLERYSTSPKAQQSHYEITFNTLDSDFYLDPHQIADTD